jgi:hypothetical protein
MARPSRTIIQEFEFAPGSLLEQRRFELVGIGHFI